MLVEYCSDRGCNCLCVQNVSSQLCGSDGELYSSECVMQAVSCSLRRHITVVDRRHCGNATNIHIFIHTSLCLKNGTRMPYNSRKCGPVSIILSLSYSWMKCRKKDGIRSIPPHLECVDALPRENRMFNCTARTMYTSNLQVAS